MVEAKTEETLKELKTKIFPPIYTWCKILYFFMPFCLFGTSSMYLQRTRLLKTVVTYTLAYNFPIRGTFSPSWIKKMSSQKTRKWCGKELRWEEEDACATPRVTRSGWSELKLPLAFFLSFFSPSLLKRNRREGREAEATGDLLDYQFDAWGEWVRKREGGERWGCAGVKGKGVKKGVMCSFPLPSAWWLQAVDFHRGLTFLHIALSLQSVWKLRPQRHESEEGWVLLWGYLCMSEGQIRNQLLINEHQFASWRTKIVPHMNIKKVMYYFNIGFAPCPGWAN